MKQDSAAKVIKCGMEAYLFGSNAKKVNFGRKHMLVPGDFMHKTMNGPPRTSSIANETAVILFEGKRPILTKRERRKCIRHINVSLTTRLSISPTAGNKTVL